MDASARYSDIVLPDTTSAETMDIVFQGQSGTMGYAILADKAIAPMFEAHDSYWICTELAKRMGVEQQFTEGLDLEGWVRRIIIDSQAKIRELPSFEQLRTMGIWRKTGTTQIALKAFRDDPVTNKLKTPSGKVEIFSTKLWDISHEWTLPEGDKITALPEFISTWEGAEEAKLNSAYTLQMIGHH
jgi:anaerobic dimethyl sulfoxide reductase subunit A